MRGPLTLTELLSNPNMTAERKILKYRHVINALPYTVLARFMNACLARRLDALSKSLRDDVPSGPSRVSAEFAQIQKCLSFDLMRDNHSDIAMKTAINCMHIASSRAAYGCKNEEREKEFAHQVEDLLTFIKEHR